MRNKTQSKPLRIEERSPDGSLNSIDFVEQKALVQRWFEEWSKGPKRRKPRLGQAIKKYGRLK